MLELFTLVGPFWHWQVLFFQNDVNELFHVQHGVKPFASEMRLLLDQIDQGLEKLFLTEERDVWLLQNVNHVWNATKEAVRKAEIAIQALANHQPH